MQIFVSLGVQAAENATNVQKIATRIDMLARFIIMKGCEGNAKVRYGSAHAEVRHWATGLATLEKKCTF
tara:strand:+ start:113 stop:319 length:207 start_codon:yes stop_codon:yes gene_type:complete